jgi:hypothetical protein
MRPRYSTRCTVWATAFFSTNGRFEHGYIHELSVPGYRLLSTATLQVGQTIDLEFRVTPEHVPIRAVLAVVRWVKGPYAGVEFIGMSPANQARLRHLMDYREDGAIPAVA